MSIRNHRLKELKMKCFQRQMIENIMIILIPCTTFYFFIAFSVVVKLECQIDRISENISS